MTPTDGDLASPQVIAPPSSGQTARSFMREPRICCSACARHCEPGNRRSTRFQRPDSSRPSSDRRLDDTSTLAVSQQAHPRAPLERARLSTPPRLTVRLRNDPGTLAPRYLPAPGHGHCLVGSAAAVFDAVTTTLTALLGTITAAHYSDTNHDHAEQWSAAMKAHGVDTAHQTTSELALLASAAGFQAESRITKKTTETRRACCMPTASATLSTELPAGRSGEPRSLPGLCATIEIYQATGGTVGVGPISPCNNEDRRRRWPGRLCIMTACNGADGGPAWATGKYRALLENYPDARRCSPSNSCAHSSA